jgi:hypothetical protein
MTTYKITVDARVLRTVTVEADNVEQAIIEANTEVIAQLGAYRAEPQQITREEETSW